MKTIWFPSMTKIRWKYIMSSSNFSPIFKDCLSKRDLKKKSSKKIEDRKDTFFPERTEWTKPISCSLSLSVQPNLQTSLLFVPEIVLPASVLVKWILYGDGPALNFVRRDISFFSSTTKKQKKNTKKNLSKKTQL